MKDPVLELDGISKSFSTPRAKGRSTTALLDVSLQLGAGETLNVVGESGCGKSTLGKIAAGLLSPDEGNARFEARAVRRGQRKRTPRIQWISQDPIGALNPKQRIADTVLEGALAHGLVPRHDRDRAARTALQQVGLDPALGPRRPHELSGGQRQRVLIARALALQPRVLVCDEPLASLDRSVQAQVLNLLMDVRQQSSVALLFISHDLAAARVLGGRTAVLYLGEIVECGPTERVLKEPAHPYTRALLACEPARPQFEERSRETAPRPIQPIAGEVPSARDRPDGCTFHPRCSVAEAQCSSKAPAARALGAGHSASCHLLDDQPQPEEPS